MFPIPQQPTPSPKPFSVSDLKKKFEEQQKPDTSSKKPTPSWKRQQNQDLYTLLLLLFQN